MRKWRDEVSSAYDKLADKYHLKRRSGTFYNEFLEMPSIFSLVNDVKGKIVLDLGCGTGICSKILKNRGSKVHGLDISPKMLDIAKSEVSGVDFREGNVYKLPYKSGYFDLVFSSLVVHYFEDLEKAFKEIRRVLKKGGYFVFSTNNPVVMTTYRMKGKPREYRIFRDYFKEGKTYVYWPKFDNFKMPYRHITMQTLIRAIAKNKFFIEDYIDTMPDVKSKRVYKSEYHSALNIPWFCVFKIKKI